TPQSQRTDNRPIDRGGSSGNCFIRGRCRSSRPGSAGGFGIVAIASIEDRVRIEDLFARYLWAIDTGDVETLVGCFTEEGSLESPAVGKYSGRRNIAEFATRFARFRENGSQLRHV